MSHFYQSLALKIRRNFYEGKKQLCFLQYQLKTFKEKFAKLFLTEIQVKFISKSFFVYFTHLKEKIKNGESFIKNFTF